MDTRIVIISGPSGIGKDTIIKEIAKKDNFRFEVPYTTRPPRSREVEGVDYHYITRSNFQVGIKNNRFLEWDYTIGHYYGFEPSLLDSKDKYVITHSLARMALRLRKLTTQIKLVFFNPLDKDRINSSLMERNIEDIEIEIRKLHGIEELDHSVMFDYMIEVNGSDRTLLQFEHLIESFGMQ